MDQLLESGHLLPMGFSTTASSWKYTNLVPTIKVPDSDYTVRIYHHCSWYAVSGTARPVNRIFRDSVQIAELGYHYIETPTNTELRQASYFVYEESPGTGTYEYQLELPI